MAIAERYPGITLPAFCTVPDIVLTAGPTVAALCESIGFAPDVEQRLGLDIVFAVNPETRKSLAFSLAIIVARQNMKSAFFEMCCIGWLFVTKEKLVIWSAHEAATAAESYLHLSNLIKESPKLSRRLPRTENQGCYTANGQQRIELANGQRILFKTRTKGSGRGLSGNKVILDEGYALDQDQLDALIPTLSAKPNPQVLYGSSAGRPESDALRGVRDRGRTGILSIKRTLAYLEWCAPPASEICEQGDSCDHKLDTPGCGYDKPEHIKAANPAFLVRITQEYIDNERAELSPHGYGRERMGWWDEPGGQTSPINANMWAERAAKNSKVIGLSALAVDVAPDETHTSLATTGLNAEGLRHVELIENRAGTGWAVDMICALVAVNKPVVTVLDPSAPAGAFVTELTTKRGFVIVKRFDEVIPAGKHRLYLVSGREYAQACGALVGDIKNSLIEHIDQAPLNRAVAGARTRPLADAWAWSRKDTSVDISPLVAVTLARHGWATFGVKKRARVRAVLV